MTARAVLLEGGRRGHGYDGAKLLVPNPFDVVESCPVVRLVAGIVQIQPSHSTKVVVPLDVGVLVDEGFRALLVGRYHVQHATGAHHKHQLQELLRQGEAGVTRSERGLASTSARCTVRAYQRASEVRRAPWAAQWMCSARTSSLGAS